MIARGKGGWKEVKKGKGEIMVVEGDLTLSGKHMVQRAGDVSWSYTFESYIILLTNVTPIKSIKKSTFHLYVKLLYY